MGGDWTDLQFGKLQNVEFTTESDFPLLIPSPKKMTPFVVGF